MTLFLIALLIFFLALGAPVAIALAAASFLVILFFGEQWYLLVAGESLVAAVDSYAVIAIGLFVFAGKLLEAAGGSDRVFGFTNRLFGRSRRSAALSVILTGLLYPDMGADTITHRNDSAAAAVNILRQAGFDTKWSLSLASITTASRVIAPPSVLIILLSIVLEQSIGRFFMAAIFIVVILNFVILMLSFIPGEDQNASAQAPQSDKLQDVMGTLPWLFAPVFILGSLILGVATPTEAGAIGICYFVLFGFAQRNLTARQVLRATLDTLEVVGGILLILSFSSVFGTLLLLDKTSIIVAEKAASSGLDPLLVLFILSALFMVSSTVLGPIASVMILAPILYPATVKLGMSPIYVGMTIVLSITSGLVIPPFGTVFAALARGTGVPLGQSTKAMAMCIIPLVFVWLLWIFFPGIFLVYLDAIF